MVCTTNYKLYFVPMEQILTYTLHQLRVNQTMNARYVCMYATYVCIYARYVCMCAKYVYMYVQNPV